MDKVDANDNSPALMTSGCYDDEDQPRAKAMKVTFNGHSTILAVHKWT